MLNKPYIITYDIHINMMCTNIYIRCNTHAMNIKKKMLHALCVAGVFFFVKCKCVEFEMKKSANL